MYITLAKTEEITMLGTCILQLLMAFAFVQEVIAIVTIKLNAKLHKDFKRGGILAFYSYFHLL